MAAEILPEQDATADMRVVLLAEDEPLIRFDIADELRRLGYRVIEAGNAVEAIAVLQSTARIDLLVTDVNMPGAGDGLDVARALKERRPDIGVIVMSGHFVPMEMDRHLIDLFVPKPVLSDRLARKIAEFMNPGTTERSR
jgi:CheY-like chemotaxis protein